MFVDWRELNAQQRETQQKRYTYHELKSKWRKSLEAMY